MAALGPNEVLLTVRMPAKAVLRIRREAKQRGNPNVSDIVRRLLDGWLAAGPEEIRAEKAAAQARQAAKPALEPKPPRVRRKAPAPARAAVDEGRPEP